MKGFGRQLNKKLLYPRSGKPTDPNGSTIGRQRSIRNTKLGTDQREREDKRTNNASAAHIHKVHKDQEKPNPTHTPTNIKKKHFTHTTKQQQNSRLHCGYVVTKLSMDTLTVIQLITQYATFVRK